MVSIISLIGLDNYGNLLQKFAVSHVIQSKGVDVENEFCLNHTSKKSLIRCWISCMKYRLHLTQDERANNFMSFSNLTKQHYSVFKWYRKKVDNYICGSDQIWSPDVISPKVNNLDFFFAKFAPKERRIAYSASFGVSTLPEDKKKEYAQYLSEMKAISVREESGAKIVKELIGKDVPVLIDPTLMLDKWDWQKVSKKPNFHIPEKFLLTYYLGEVSDERNQYLEKVASENGLEIIRLEAHNHNKAWWKTGPSEFIWLIEHCSLMCTDSFHGSVFSILMEVPFLVFDREDTLGDMSSRIETLLSKFKLEDRKFNDQQGRAVFEKNYQHIQGILDIERRKALDYLSEALELKNENKSN